jgi:hypothetical protein
VNFLCEYVVTVVCFCLGNLNNGLRAVEFFHFIRRINCQPLLLVWWASSASSLEKDRLWWRCLFRTSNVVLMGFDCLSLGVGSQGVGEVHGGLVPDGMTCGGVSLGLVCWDWL